MTFTFDIQPAPLQQDEHGDIRVGDSRVLLDLVVRAFEDGATPESIVEMYSTLRLADVYGAISYYLLNREAVADYLRRREEKGAQIRQTIESQQTDLREIRQRLMARKEAKDNRHASAD